MNGTTTCPAPASLQLYLLGRMSEATAADVESHVASCPLCRKLLPTVRAEDDFVADFRAQAGRPPAANPLLDRLAGDLRGLLCGLPTGRDQTPPADGEATPAHGGPAAGDVDDVYTLLAPARAPDEMGRLGDYRVLKVLGQGGMGVVFLAEDTRLQRQVALKAMKPALAASARARQRFLREAKLAASLTHDNIVTIHQCGEENGVPFLAMPLLPGETLDTRLKREGRLPTAEVLRIGREAAEGLAAAHEHGLIHRDIKPANLWLETRPGEPGGSSPRYRVKVLDFGLARAADGDAQLTQSGMVMGTPAYMAPEQADGRADHRADLFSLGCVLYRMAAGQAPFAGEAALEVLRRVATDQPRPPLELNPETPPALSDLILRLLAKDPAQRPPSATEVIQTLQTIQSTPVEKVRPGQDAPSASATLPMPPRTAPAPIRGKRRRWIAAAVLAAFLATAAVAAVVIIRDSNGNKVAEVKVPDRGKVEIIDDGTSGVPAVPPNPPAVPPPEVSTSEPMSSLALVRRPAKIPGVESWSIETIAPRGGVKCFLSPDGKQVAAFGDDGVVRVWNTEDGHLAAALLGHKEKGELVNVPGQVLAWSPDGQRLATLDASEVLKTWDVRTGKNLLTVTSAKNTAVAWSPNGKMLATAGGNTFAIWDANTQEKIDIVQTSLGIGQLAWSPDSKMLAAANWGGGEEIWDVQRGKKVGSNKIHDFSVPVWSHAGKMLAMSDVDKVTLLDGQTADAIGTIDDVPHGALYFTKDDKTILCGSGEWDVASGKKVRPLQSDPLLRLLPGEDKINQLDFWSADGRYCAGLGVNSGWKVWDATTGKVVFRLPEEIGGRTSWDFSPDGKSLAMATYAGPLRIWDLPSSQAHVAWEYVAQVWAVRWSPDGKYLLLHAGSTGDSLFETSSWKRLQDPDHMDINGGGALWSLDSKTIAGGCYNGGVGIWTPDTAKPRQLLQLDCDFFTLSPDGKWLAAARDKTVKVWDTTTGKVVHTFPCLSGAATSGAWSPDGSLLAFGEHGSSSAVRLWDPQAEKVVQSLEGPDGWGQNLAWSPDGKTVISVDEKGAIRRWDHRTSTELHTAKGPPSHGGAYSRDMKLLAARGIPAAAVLWDVAENRELGVLATLPNAESIAISPDGHYRISPVRPDKLIVYVVKTANGQEVLTPTEFADRYHWKNDPNKVQLTVK